MTPRDQYGEGVVGDPDPIKCECALCGADWEGHDKCPVERQWAILFNVIGIAYAVIMLSLTYAVLFR